MKELFRESLPEMIGGLVVAGVISIIGVLYAQLGLINAIVIIISILLITFIVIILVSFFKKGRKKPQLSEIHSESKKPLQNNNNSQVVILFVDDEPEFSSQTISSLEFEGYMVIIATNVNEALNIINSGQKLDLVIADMLLPIHDNEKDKDYSNPMGGLTLIKEIKKANNNFPIVVLSIVSEKLVADELIKLGVEDIILKPVFPGVVVEKVKLVLYKFRGSNHINLIPDEVKRRKLQLKSNEESNRIKAILALMELTMHDSSIVHDLEYILKSDKSSEVRKVARMALKKIGK